MMKIFALILAAILLASASAFAPQAFVQEQSLSVCHATHVNDKAAKWAASKRPKKSRPSDINRKPIVYALHSIQKPAEYTISEAAATPVTKPEN